MGLWAGVAALILSLMAAPVGGFVFMFYCFPHLMIRLGLRYQSYRSGMTIKYIGNENNVYCYAEKNRPQKDKVTILFIHGFTSSKDQWISCFQQLPGDLHMIALDMPGHGGSSRPDDGEAMSFDRAVDLVHEFLQLVDLGGQRLHLVGSSLGGAIVGLYAAKYPLRVDRVTMACPVVETPIDTDLQLQVRQMSGKSLDQVTYDDCLLLTKDIEQLKELFFRMSFSKSMSNLHVQIYKGILNLRLPNLPYYLKLFKSLAKVNQLDTMLKEAHRITAPAQIVWGKDDELIHVSGAEVLRARLSNCRHVDLIERCGHAIHMDRPGYFTKVLLKFYMDGSSTKQE